jgi:CheY-like chemotaxis protein
LLESASPGEVTYLDSGSPPLTGVKVLVVEDDGATRYIFSRQLSQAGAIVTVVEDAKSALRVLCGESIDVLMVDLKLPGAEGLQLLARAPARSFVTIAVTTFADEEMRERAAAAGFNAFLPKPVELERLVQEIARRVPEIRDQREH